jgi:citrate synthase
LRSLPSALKEVLERIPKDAHPMDVLRTGTSMLGISGSETFTLEDLRGAPEPGSIFNLAIRRKDGSVTCTRVKCRIDTSQERQVFEAGGRLPRIAREMRSDALQGSSTQLIQE